MAPAAALSTDESPALYLHGNQVVSDVQVTQYKTSDVF